MASNADNVDSKLWPKLVVKEFIDIMVDEVTNGNMPNGVFNTRTWTSMTTKLNFKAKSSYKKEQLKAKMHRLRALYREFSALVNHTGFGWDPETNTVTASEEVWKDYIRVHDKAAQFQRRGLDHYNLLGIIFNKNTATGVLHHSSTQDPPNTDEEIELENQYRNNGDHVNLDNDSSNDDVQELERVTRSGKRQIQEKEGKSKKSTRTMQMGDALAAWADASKARAERYRGHSMEATSSIVTPDYSITKCVTALEGIEGISVDTYMKACEKFKEAEYREMFLAMSAEMRHAWLHRL
ncbi:hypothetical protein OROGR_011004 [Orobanche gracilis]